MAEKSKREIKDELEDLEPTREDEQLTVVIRQELVDSNAAFVETVKEEEIEL